MRYRSAFRTVLSCVLLAALFGCQAPAPQPEAEATADLERSAPEEMPPDLGPLVEVADAAAQIAAAVMAAPQDRREAASVYGYDGEGQLVLLRRGAGELICIADTPGDERFHVACYHQSLEAYMARGRELRAAGVEGSDTLATRHEEIDSGTLLMPRQPAVVYGLSGSAAMHDAASGAVDEAQGMRVNAVYVAYATEASTGLSTVPPQPGAPWIMRPGTPTSHIMVVLEPTAEAAPGS